MKNNAKFPSSELTKLIFFVFIQIITCVFLIGIIPTIIFITSYFLMRRDRSVEIVLKAVKIVVIYTKTLVILIFIVVLLNFMWDEIDLDMVLIFSIITLISGGLYLTLLTNLVHKPVEIYGEYLSKQAALTETQESTSTILNKENNKIYSVADELLKWKELKDNGVITEEEFVQMKAKIMKK